MTPPAVQRPAGPPLLWDIFCRVIDNHGDLGVCWRLSQQLAALGQRVRLWVDEPAALAWMAPHAAWDALAKTPGPVGVQALRSVAAFVAFDPSATSDPSASSAACDPSAACVVCNSGAPSTSCAPGSASEVILLPWRTPFFSGITPQALAALPQADVWVEAFGCEIATEFIANYVENTCRSTDFSSSTTKPPQPAKPATQAAHDTPHATLHAALQTTAHGAPPGTQTPSAEAMRGLHATAHGAPPPGPDARAAPVWINLEYLSAESHVERCHGLPSPVLAGTGEGLTKHFFYPGFTPGTGGLLREDGLLAAQQHFARHERAGWLAAHGLAPQPGQALVSLFCYEPAALTPWLDQLAATPLAGFERTQLLVTAGRAAAAVQAWQKTGCGTSNGHSLLSISYLPYLPQTDYDRLLWACDLNFVRGEDSLVRALWAGQPFIWHIYPQHDNAHHAKLQAFLDWLDAPPSLRRFHHRWNGLPPPPESAAAVGPASSAQPTFSAQPPARSHPGALPALPALPTPPAAAQPTLDAPPVELPTWTACVQAARARLMAQPDLARQLLGFVLEKR